MASAVLASGNESNWGQSSGGFMGKLPYHLNPNPNPNPKHKPIPKKKKFHALSGQINGGRHTDDSPAVTQAASDDAYSFNQKPIESSNRRDFNHGGYVSFNIASYARSELIELKKRLILELEQIRNLNDRIESGQFQPRSSQLPVKSKKLLGNKRPLLSVSGNDSKRLCENGIGGNVHVNANLMKMCRQVLTNLMKHKHSWIFKSPVDAVSMGLHDYHQIVKHPMDLGTVKLNFTKNSYSSPIEFASDVRLTFNNAMLYNPKGDEVYAMAELLLARFEELFRPINNQLQGDQKEKCDLVDDDDLQGSSWNSIPTPESSKRPKSNPIPKNSKRIEQIPIPSTSSNPPNPRPSTSSNPPNPLLSQSPVRTPPPMQTPPVKPAMARSNPGKQPKPKAKDLDKREMSMEEKHKLGIGLQSLPPEKMPQLVQIIRKRNGHLAQEGDEIELDIEALDTETLWELDRFVTNWKKMVSKTKRQALMVNTNSATITAEADKLPEKTEMVKKTKKGDAGEEDVDIGDDEMPMSSFPPLEIEKDVGGHDHDHEHGHGNATSSSSSSSSSSSDSSSSSASDSGSSSGSDSDADDAQSRGIESKEFGKS